MLEIFALVLALLSKLHLRINSALQEQRRAAARAESLLQARLARQGAQGEGASLGAAQTAALMQVNT